MSWCAVVQKTPREVKGKIYRTKDRTDYYRQWEQDNRVRRNKYHREYYRAHYEARRAYLNQKQREYRSENRNRVP